jgi:hypothetical protein
MGPTTKPGPLMTGGFSVVKGPTYQLQIQVLGAKTALTQNQIQSDLVQQGWSPIMSTLVIAPSTRFDAMVSNIFTVNATWNAPAGQVSREVSPVLNILNMTMAPSATPSASSGSYARGYSNYSSIYRPWPRV